MKLDAFKMFLFEQQKQFSTFFLTIKIFVEELMVEKTCAFIFITVTFVLKGSSIVSFNIRQDGLSSERKLLQQHTDQLQNTNLWNNPPLINLTVSKCFYQKFINHY